MTRWSTPTVSGLPHTGQIFPIFMDSSGSRTTLQARCRQGGIFLPQGRTRPSPGRCSLSLPRPGRPGAARRICRHRKACLQRDWLRGRGFPRNARRSWKRAHNGRARTRAGSCPDRRKGRFPGRKYVRRAIRSSLPARQSRIWNQTAKTTASRYARE